MYIYFFFFNIIYKLIKNPEPLITCHTVITCRPQLTSNRCRPLSKGVKSDTFPGHRTAPCNHLIRGDNILFFKLWLPE